MVETYAGVPHLKSDRAYNGALAKLSRSTQGKIESHFGGFSALVDFQKFKFHHPILVSTTDGVGTKLELARFLNKHDTIGIDLVAMCVNDLVTSGAQPIFFLDYFAAGVFDQKRTLAVIKGIAKGCRESGCALLGGETAIMPGFYADSTYDLAGFAVGAVEKSKVIDGRTVRAGDVILGFQSSGFHSNGFSLIRKVFSKKELSSAIGRTLLTPTRIYVRPILELIHRISVGAVAHITGGGLYDNLPRVLPKGLTARIVKKSWPIHKLFAEVQNRARYSERQMYHTFNMGIGMVVVLKRLDAALAQQILRKQGVDSWIIGVVEKGREVNIQ